jgi:hypothetical protein
MKVRATTAGIVAIVVATGSTVAIAANRLTPDEIKSTFFNGQPFTATASSTKYKMVFAADGTMAREPLGKRGVKSEGTWKLSKDGYCTTWVGYKPKCFTVQLAAKNKWSVVTGKKFTAFWSK